MIKDNITNYGKSKADRLLNREASPVPRYGWDERGFSFSSSKPKAASLSPRIASRRSFQF